jgi:hypothetical protein
VRLCALAIAASAVVVLSGSATDALKAALALEMRQGARVVLQSILSDELAAESTAPAVREGDSGPYRWRLEIRQEAAAFAAALPSSVRMYRLTATVIWGSGGTASATALKLSRR